MENSSKKSSSHTSSVRPIAISAALAAFTLTLALYELASIMPLMTQVFAQEAPEQSCNPPGLRQSGTSFNPNCVSVTPIPNCVSDPPVGEADCRNVGTCSSAGPGSFNRPFDQTPACPEEEEEP